MLSDLLYRMEILISFQGNVKMSPNIKQFDIKGRWTSAPGSIPLCLVQPNAPPRSHTGWNQFHDLNLELAKKILRGDEALLNKIFPETDTSLVVFPELAFSFDHWNELNDLVNARSGPMILAAGIGFVSGQKLLEWQKQDTGHRFGTWDIPNELIKERVYNAAFIWVHTQETTDCYCLLKQHPQQTAELPEIENWVGGPRPVVLVAEDLCLYPLICFDFLTSGQGAPGDEVLTNLDTLHRNKKALILGMVLQKEPTHPLWMSRVSELTKKIKDYPTAIILCHYGEDDPSSDKNKDQWRCMTGVYRNREKVIYWTDGGPLCLNHSIGAGRKLLVPPINGTVIRYSHGCIVGGFLNFDYAQDGCRHLWEAKTAFDVTGKEPLSPEVYEILRLLRRYPKIDLSHNLNKIIEEALHNIQKIMDKELAQSLCSGFAIGEDFMNRKKIDHDGLDEWAVDWISCFQVFALMLNCCQDVEIRRSNNGFCDLLWPKKNGIVRMWSIKGLSRPEIKEKIEHWVLESGAHNPILLVARGDGAQQPDPYRPNEVRRADRPSLPEGRNAVHGNSDREIYCLPWYKLSDVMIDTDLRRAKKSLEDTLSSHFEIKEITV
ncbi:hypothetical protein CCP2SC5_490008 [Azospirillaceae bacterium]